MGWIVSLQNSYGDLISFLRKWAYLGIGLYRYIIKLKLGHRVDLDPLMTDTLRRACMRSHFSCIWLFANLWTVAHQAHPSMGFSRSGVDCHALFQGIFPSQGLNPHLLSFLHWQGSSLSPIPLGKPKPLIWISFRKNHKAWIFCALILFHNAWDPFRLLCLLVAQLCPTLWNRWTIAH